MKKTGMKRMGRAGMAAALLLFAWTLGACGQSGKKAENNASSAASVSGANAAGAESTEPDSLMNAQASTGEQDTGTTTIRGVIIDASMNTVTIQTQDGKTLSFHQSEDESAEGEFDTTALKSGMELGNGVELSYQGKVEGTDTSKARRVVMKDATPACKNAQALEKAGEIILALEDQDYNTLSSLSAIKLSKKDFTEDFVQSVVTMNLFDAPLTKDGFFLPGKEAKPNLELGEIDGEWTITGLNR